MGGGGGAASKDSSSKSDIAGYQQYYQQYMGGGSKDSSSKSNTTGYQQYYQQYMGGGSSKSGQGGYQQYYQQYMGGGKNSSSKSNNGSYQKYYQQHVGASSNSSSGGYDQYYQQYIGGGAKNASGKSNTGGYQQYYQQHIGGSSKSVEQVTSCSTDTCVKEWYKEKEADVKKFVPKDYQHFQLKAIEKEYKKNLARVATKNNSTNGLSTSDDFAHVSDALAAKLAIVPPMLLAQVSACTTKQCVENWRNKTEAEIESVVPKDYQHFALASIQKAYKKNLARVAQANASNSTNSTGAFLAAAKANPQSFSSFQFVAIAFFALVPGFFVLRLRARQREVDLV